MRHAFKKVSAAVRRRRWRKKYQVGKTVSHFVVFDVKREVLVESVDELEAGYITARIRTRNLLYEGYGLMEEPDFGPPIRVAIQDLWKWSGQPWGGLENGWSALGEHAAGRLDLGENDEAD